MFAYVPPHHVPVSMEGGLALAFTTSLCTRICTTGGGRFPGGIQPFDWGWFPWLTHPCTNLHPTHGTKMGCIPFVHPLDEKWGWACSPLVPTFHGSIVGFQIPYKTRSKPRHQRIPLRWMDFKARKGRRKGSEADPSTRAMQRHATIGTNETIVDSHGDRNDMKQPPHTKGCVCRTKGKTCLLHRGKGPETNASHVQTKDARCGTKWAESHSYRNDSCSPPTPIYSPTIERRKATKKERPSSDSPISCIGCKGSFAYSFDGTTWNPRTRSTKNGMTYRFSRATRLGKSLLFA